MRRRKRSGISILYVVIMMTALMGFSSLAVDYGRVQLCKSQVILAADAAVLYGITGITISPATARSRAIAAAADNTVDGTPVVLTNSEIELGTWNPGARTFTVLYGAAESGANAMRVTVSRTKAKGNPIPLLFGQVVGATGCNVQAKSTALLSNATFNTTVPGSADPYLAGMPNGTTASYGGSGTAGDPFQHDTAPAQSPVNSGGPVVGGMTLTFNASGTSSYDPVVAQVGPGGDPTNLLSHNGGAEHGIAGYTAPSSALIGVFLDDNAPDTSVAPSSLDFSTAASRDFTSLSPQLKQVFYIGSGKNSSNVVQQFIAPPGATRLFLGTVDGFGWLDNVGSLSVTMTRKKVGLVR